MRLVIAGAILMAALASDGGSAVAQSSCPDLTGSYVRRHEDGPVHITIEQTRCESMRFEWRSQYLEERPVTQSHTLRLDGQFRDVGGMFGPNGRALTAAMFRNGVLEILTKPVTLENKIVPARQIRIRRLADGDVCYASDEKQPQGPDRRRYALIRGTSLDAERIAGDRSEAQPCDVSIRAS